MTFSFETDLAQYADVMARNLKDVADDLRTVDLADIVGYVRFGSYATIEDLLQSSTELFFKHGALSFGWTAEVDVTWEDTPTLTVGMEFRHRAVSVFFDLSLRARDETVKVSGIIFEKPLSGTREKVSSLCEAIAQARLPERSGSGPRPAARLAASRRLGGDPRTAR